MNHAMKNQFAFLSRTRRTPVLLFVVLLTMVSMYARLSAAQSTDASFNGTTLLTSGASSSTSTDASVTAVSASGATTQPTGLSEFEQGAPQVQTRPRLTPTADQLEALRLLEGEIGDFTSRGDQFRRSVNGLLRREHDNQLVRLRQGFERQIDIERTAEGQARRNAIAIFERFIESYPNDQEHTADVMFRLAELYYDEAKYAKLEADQRFDDARQAREAAQQPTDDLVAPPPADYRCSILLYRHIATRFQGFRLRDATYYLLGWVLKEMGKEDEAIMAYRNLVCPARFQYRSTMDLGSALVEGQNTPLMCAHLADVLRPFGPELYTPAARAAVVATTDADGGTVAAPSNGLSDEINATLVAAGTSTDTEPMPIPRDYQDCVPLNGANGRASRYTPEVWYYIGDYHFDNPPIDADLGNAYAIAAYEASMRSSETRRLPSEIERAQNASATPAVGIAGAGQNNADPGMVLPENSPGRAQFDAAISYGPFWSKSLYKIGWGFFRMQNGYPRALTTFARLLDYYDYVGGQEATSGNRGDTIKWIGVIFSESTWNLLPSNEQFECQSIVEAVATPPAEATRPFDCAGIVRITSPYNATQLATGPVNPQRGAARVPVPGRPTHLPQDRPWTPEAYLELANDYFQQTKYYEAITLYKLFLRIYPLHFMAPRVAENIAISYERQRQFDAAITARDQLRNYTDPSPWWNANNSHPDAQRHAETVARNSLHDTAIEHHRRASSARQRAAYLTFCAAGQNPGVDPPVCAPARNPRERGELESRAFGELQRGQTEYGLAVDAYTSFIRNYPNDDAAYEFKYNRADALYWSRRYADAARAYSDVRESNENDQYLAASAYMTIKSFEAAIVEEVRQGRLAPCLAVRAGVDASQLSYPAGVAPLQGAELQACKDLPLQPQAAPATGSSSATPPAGRALEMNIPDMVRSLMEARVLYVQRVPRQQDSLRGLAEVYQPPPPLPEGLSADERTAEQTRRDYNAPPYRAKFAYLNGRTQLRFGHVREAEEAYRYILREFCQDQLVAQAAFADLFNMLLSLGRTDDRDALAEQQAQSACAGVSRDVVGPVLTDREFRRALEVFHRAEQANGDAARALYDEAASVMLEAVNRNRNHPQAPQALFYVALSYERTNRFDSATQTYIRVTQDYNNTFVNGTQRELEGADRQSRIDSLEQSNFRAAINLDRTFDYDGAVRYFESVVRDSRFGSAAGHGEHVHDSLASIALIRTNTGDWARARDAWRAFLPVADAGREHSTAEYRIAEMPFRARDWAGAVRAFQEYRRGVPMNPETAEFHVQAQYNIAQALKNNNDQVGFRRELRRVADVFRQSRQPPGSRAAAFAAEALYQDLDVRVHDFMQRTLTQGTGTELARQIRTLKTELDGIDTQAGEIIDLQGGEYTVGALVRRGEAHEYLATQEVRISTLLRLSTQQTQQLARAEAGAARLDRLADQLGGRNEALETRLRNQAQEIRDRVQQMRDGMTTTVQQQYDTEAESERKLAIQDYAIAIHLARRNNIPTQFAATALEHIRIEENRPLVDAALRGLSPQLVQRVGFAYTPNMFSTEAPGATLTQQAAIATPGLVGE
jgi:tetratricopeptide (TPR) repeat protein